jgi:hypothetical protein
VSPRRRRLAAVTVALAALALALLTVVPFGSAEEPTPRPVALAASRPSAPPPTVGIHLRLRVDSMAPRVVTSAGPPTLSVAGELINVGDQPLTDVRIRTQRGERLRTEGEVRTALSGDADSAAVIPAFIPVADQLAPGQQVPVRLNVPLRGSPGDSLALDRAGVYELGLIVDATSANGAPRRLAGVRMLLPVLGLPSVDGLPAEGGTPDGKALRVSLLYPLADQPHLLPTGPGEPVLLGDDQLAASLSPGGRLDGLLTALETGAPAGSALWPATCLAVDPDLLRSVEDMSGGYQVRAPDGRETDGQGAAAAARWLGRLRKVAAGHCVLTIPYADADLVALARAGLDDLADYAVRDGARIASEILRTPVRASTIWPGDGLLDERSLGNFLRVGGRSVVLSAEAVTASGATNHPLTSGVAKVASADGSAMALLTDPLISRAAAGTGGGLPTGNAFSADVGDTRSPRQTGDTLSPAGTGAPLSAQDVIGAVAFRALDKYGPGDAPDPLVIAPPHRWATTGVGARELLAEVDTLIRAQRFDPAMPPAIQRAESEPPAATLVYSLRAGAREVPTSVTARLSTDRDTASTLRATAQAEPGVGSTPAQVFDPVTEGMLRAGSAVWRGHSDFAEAAAAVITQRVRLLRSLVRVLQPPSPYALGGEEAPLPITLANGLPVAMRVRVVLSDTPGLHTEAISPKTIPPMGRLQLPVNAKLSRAGQFTVEARLTTLSGTPLGTPSRLQLRSTAYGTITVWLTGTAGLLLVILAVRRIARRLRAGAPARQAGRPPLEPRTAVRPRRIEPNPSGPAGRSEVERQTPRARSVGPRKNSEIRDRSGSAPAHPASRMGEQARTPIQPPSRNDGPAGGDRAPRDGGQPAPGRSRTPPDPSQPRDRACTPPGNAGPTRNQPPVHPEIPPNAPVVPRSPVPPVLDTPRAPGTPPPPGTGPTRAAPNARPAPITRPPRSAEPPARPTPLARPNSPTPPARPIPSIPPTAPTPPTPPTPPTMPGVRGR